MYKYIYVQFSIFYLAFNTLRMQRMCIIYIVNKWILKYLIKKKKYYSCSNFLLKKMSEQINNHNNQNENL